MRDLPYNTNKYLLAFGMLAGIIFFLWMISSDKKFSCDEWADGFKNNFQCNIVLLSKERGSGIVTLKGRNIKTGNIESDDDDSKWITDNFDSFKIGDTVIKNKGEYTIYIKRSGKTISINFQCGDKIYRD